MHSSAVALRSPAVMSMSISRPGWTLDTSPASRISSSVSLPMALTTTTTSSPRRFVRATWSATSRMRSGSATEVPPNFWTTSDTAVDATAGPRDPRTRWRRPRRPGRLGAHRAPLLFAAMPSEKRQRQDEGRLIRLEEQRSATQKVQRKRQARTLGLIIGAIVVVAGGIAIFSADDADDAERPPTPSDHAPTPPTPTAENVVLPGAGREHHRRDALPAGRRLGRAHHRLRAGAADVHRPGQDLHRHPRDHRGRHRRSSSTPRTRPRR